MLKKFYTSWPVMVLLLAEVALFFANYDSGTYLLGWDNIMPEFHFWANLDRNINGVWAGYRGLGLLDGMAHTANITHTLTIGLLSLILPQSLIRWVFVFGMHVLGGIGMYMLLTTLRFAGTHSSHPELGSGSIRSNRFRIKSGMTQSIALFGALFYQYNLATVQMFYAPLEVFIIHFAALPWLTWGLLKYLNTPSRKYLLLFAILSLLFTPQSFVPSVWIAYTISVAVIFLSFCFEKKKFLIRRFITLALVIVSVNAFWLLPYAYSAVQNADIIASTKINIMSNEDIILKQKEFGDFVSTAFLKGFILNQTDYFQETGQFGYMMEPWRNALSSLWMKVVLWSLFGLSILGVAASFVKREWRYIPFSLLYIFSLAMLGTEVPGVSVIPWLFNTFIPYFDVVFRFAFTKFSLLYAFVYAIMLVYGLHILLQRLSVKLARNTVIAIIFGCIIILSLPSFSGDFIYRNMRVSFPNEYIELFDYFKKRPKHERIALLPAHQYWSWMYYDWNARGSGFLWYGIEQPTLDRAFDPWSRNNENFYWELSQSIYSENPEEFRSVLEKYQVDWLLLDSHVISPDNPRGLYTDRLRQIIDQSGTIVRLRSFGSMDLYAVNLPQEIEEGLLISEAVSVSPSYKWGNYDAAYHKHNMYYEDIQNADIIVPFPSVFSGRNTQEYPFSISETSDSFILTSRQSIPDSYRVVESDQRVYNVTLSPYVIDDDSITSSLISQEPVSIQLPKVNSIFSIESNVVGNNGILNATSCDSFRNGTIDRYITPDSFVRFTSTNSSNCYTFDYPQHPHRLGYVIKVDSRWYKGKPLRVGIINTTSGKVEIDVFLPKNSQAKSSYIFVPPLDPYGVGYKIYIDNVSIGSVETTNDLRSVVIYPIPYYYVANLMFENINSEKDQILIRSDSFDPGWKAYRYRNNQQSTFNKQLFEWFPFIFGEELTEHVLVNNWANGWILPEAESNDELRVTNDELRTTNGELRVTSDEWENYTTIKIIFLPQYLQYIGFGLFGVGLVWVLLYKSKG